MPANIEAAMLEMFRAEVETHMAALSDGLLALEKQPSQSDRFEGLMRAAHSIKGAAKIVGLPAAVQVAHAIEDCFVAARRGEASMTSGLVDVLLEGIDLLARAADVDDSGFPTLADNDPRIAAIAVRIQSAARGEAPAPAPKPATKTPDNLFAPPLLSGHWLASQGDALTAASVDLHAVASLDAAALAYLSLAAREATPPRLLAANVPVQHLLSVVGLGALLTSSVAES
jgi:chemotaxis protein histidine kinase CheA